MPGLRWSEIDLARRSARLVDTKTGALVSPSSELACAMISARHEIDDLMYQSIRSVAGQLSKYFVPIATSCVV